MKIENELVNLQTNQTLNWNFIARLPAPSELGIRVIIRRALGCTSTQPVRVGYLFVKIRGELLCNHDLYHLEVSCLERIQMGKHQVSGIHGINSLVFHDSALTEEYDALLDEARVALHEWLTRPAIFNTFKVLCWLIWLGLQGINPLAVTIRHLRTLKRQKCMMPLVKKMSFVSSLE